MIFYPSWQGEFWGTHQKTGTAFHTEILHTMKEEWSPQKEDFTSVTRMDRMITAHFAAPQSRDLGAS